MGNMEQIDLTELDFEHPTREELEIGPILQALSDPQRLEIIRLLGDEAKPRPCGSFNLGLAKSTMSHHIKVLREAGLIVQMREGTTKLTWLRRDDVDARFPGLLDAVLAGAQPPVPAPA